jgi:hypothetical protein
LASKIVKAFPFSFINFKSQSVAQITIYKGKIKYDWRNWLATGGYWSGMDSEKVRLATSNSTRFRKSRGQTDQ